MTDNVRDLRSKPKPRPARAANARELAERVRAQYCKYVVFHADYAGAEADTMTLWTLHSHAFAAAECTPYPLIQAPTPEAGKSKIIDVAQHLVASPAVVHDPTPSSLFRMIDTERPTLFVDEVDTLAESKPLRAVLNSGNRLGGYVSRSQKVGGEWVSVRFATFCPKLFAGIAGRRLPLTGATLSRCVQIPMQRKRADEQAEPFRHRVARAESVPILRALTTWGEQAVPSLKTAMPNIPAGLSDRQGECWEPLFAIGELLGGDWAERAERAALALSDHAAAPPDAGTQLLADLKAVWRQVDGKRCHTSVLAARRNALEDRHYQDELSAQDLSVWLTRFGIRPLPNAFRQGGKQARGYERAAFTDVLARYVR